MLKLFSNNLLSISSARPRAGREQAERTLPSKCSPQSSLSESLSKSYFSPKSGRLLSELLQDCLSNSKVRSLSLALS